MEERISHVTDSKRTQIDLWDGLQGPKSTRETRMEVVAWIAICTFNCRLEGGFVRDWIVGHYVHRPKANKQPLEKWLSFRTNPEKVQIPAIDKEIVPADLDCHLPVFSYFDIDRFLDLMHKYQIECRVIREDWRYILLLDEHSKTGPFTMDLIEPHVALTHDRIDLDVSNLSVEKDYTKEIGMRVDTEQAPYSIDLEEIIEHIHEKKFRVLRPIDQELSERIEKMTKIRGWTMIEPPMHVIPKPPKKYRVVLVPLPKSFDLYKEIVKRIRAAIPNVNIIKIEELRNPGLEALYYGMKGLIESQSRDSNVNERDLFHGTKGNAIDGIKTYGYDDRYSGSTTSHGGDWGECIMEMRSYSHFIVFFCDTGHGLYFADNPGAHVHGHTAPHDQDQTRVMFYNKVILGRIYEMNKIDPNLKAAPVGFHSVHGTHAGRPDDDEYIIYRYGQALPYLKITYRVGGTH